MAGRRRRAHPITPGRGPGPGPAPAPLPAPTRRHTTTLIALGLALVAGTAAWLIIGLFIARATAARLPALPDRAALPASVADELASADAAARRAPSATTVGDLGLAYHAALRPDEALQAYTLAEGMSRGDWSWTYYRGLLLEERGDHTAATEAFSRVTRLAAGHGLAHFRLGEIAFKAGQLPEAEAAYQSASQAGGVPAPAIAMPDLPARRPIPLDAYAKVGLARVRLEKGDTAGARLLLSEVVAAHPRFGSAQALLRQLSAGSVLTGGQGRAYAPPPDPWLDVVIARSRHSDLLLKHAAIATRTGDDAWRAWLAGRALEANPTGLDTLLEMAGVNQDAGRHTEALALLRRAESVAPGDHHVLVEQGQSLFELGRLQEAEQVLRRAVRVQDAAAEYNLATVLDAMDRWDEARGHYERALAINPFHARALNNLGIGLGRRGQYPEAIALYRRGIVAAPANADAYTNLGGALMATRQFEAALEVLRTAVEIDPQQANPHNNRGIVLAMMGRPSEARQAFATAIRLDPSHSDARRNLAALDGRPPR